MLGIDSSTPSRRDAEKPVCCELPLESAAAIGSDAALNAGKGTEGREKRGRGVVLDGGVEKIGVGEVIVEAFDLVIPELGFDAAEAAWRQPGYVCPHKDRDH